VLEVTNKSKVDRGNPNGKSKGKIRISQGQLNIRGARGKGWERETDLYAKKSLFTRNRHCFSKTVNEGLWMSEGPKNLNEEGGQERDESLGAPYQNNLPERVMEPKTGTRVKSKDTLNGQEIKGKYSSG